MMQGPSVRAPSLPAASQLRSRGGLLLGRGQQGPGAWHAPCSMVQSAQGLRLEPTVDVTVAPGQGSRDWLHSSQNTRGWKCVQMVSPQQQTHHRLPLPQVPLPQVRAHGCSNNITPPASTSSKLNTPHAVPHWAHHVHWRLHT